MRLSIPQYAQALLEIGKDVQDAKETNKRFLAWLTRRGEEKKLPKIIAEADRIVREQSGVIRVTITTAHPADEKTKESLRIQAEKIFSGKKIEASFLTDASVIGGAKIQSEEVLYDATLSMAARKLRANLS